jgi:hypothetical protein
MSSTDEQVSLKLARIFLYKEVVNRKHRPQKNNLGKRI